MAYSAAIKLGVIKIEIFRNLECNLEMFVTHTDINKGLPHNARLPPPLRRANGQVTALIDEMEGRTEGLSSRHTAEPSGQPPFSESERSVKYSKSNAFVWVLEIGCFFVKSTFLVLFLRKITFSQVPTVATWLGFPVLWRKKFPKFPKYLKILKKFEKTSWSYLIELCLKPIFS